MAVKVSYTNYLKVLKYSEKTYFSFISDDDKRFWMYTFIHGSFFVKENFFRFQMIFNVQSHRQKANE